MEESISTSASSVRTLYQRNPTENTSQISGRREQAPPGSIHIGSSTNGLGVIDADNGCAQRSPGGPSSSSSGTGLTCVSVPSSPHMHALVLPSPSDSPGSPSPSTGSISESSLPSVSSSFFFSSSAPGSPGRSHPSSYPQSDHEHDQDDLGRHRGRAVEHGLIIPSLFLPDSLRRPTPFGQTLGNLKILVLGGQGAGKSFLTGLLLEDNEDVVDVGTWEDWHGGGDGKYTYGKILRASTSWTEQHDIFGLDRCEPAKNVEIIELPGYSHDADSNDLITRLKAIVEMPFRALHDVLHPETQPSATVANMLAASTSPLYTAMIFLLPSTPTQLDKEIISALSSYVPLVVLPRLHGPNRALRTGPSSSAKLSTFRPVSAVALRSGLFHSPETVALLREEAVDRFLRWREVERAVEVIHEGTQGVRKGKRPTSGRGARRKLGEKEWGRRQNESEENGGEMPPGKVEKWNKAKWEADWMESFSHDVAKRMKEGTITKRGSRRDTISALRDPKNNEAPNIETESDHQRGAQERQDGTRRYYANTPFDPLHLPSLLFFSVSLLGPLRTRIGETMRDMVESLGETRVQLALVGGFCVGLGIGVYARVW